MERLALVGPDVQKVIDRITCGLAHLREEYYEEFRMIVLKQAGEEVEHGDPRAAVEKANAALRALSEWAFRKEP